MFCVVQNRFTVFVSCITWQQTWLGTFQGTSCMNQYTDEEKKNIKRKGNKQIYWNDNSSKHNKTFRISPGKGKTSYLLLTSRL